MQSKLQKILQRGTERGFKYEPLQMTDGVHSVVIKIPETMIFRHILLSKDFAKSYWGEEETPTHYHMGEFADAWLPAYQYHLQMAVISEDLLTYYEDNPN